MSWTIPNMWEGGECWILGGGPSLPLEFGIPTEVIDSVHRGEADISAYSPYLSAIHDRHVIACNTAFLLGEWVDLILFGDAHFYFRNKEALIKHPKPKIAINKSAQNELSKTGVKMLQRNRSRLNGLCTDPTKCCWNLSTGGAAINLATLLGARTINLLGFDMVLGENDKQHWHSHYKDENSLRKARKRQTPFYRHLKAFPSIAADAKKLGIQINNISQISSIEVFEKKRLEEVL